MKQLYFNAKDFIGQIYHHRNLILELTKRDFNTKYIKNYFGLAWAILDPLFFILILFFVFGMRYGNQEVLGTPFINYLICGYIAYDFFNNTLGQMVGSIQSYSFLIKKVDFHSAIIPMFKILSHSIMHGILLILSIIILICNGVVPELMIIQIVYYHFALGFLLIGLGWITAAIYPFFPDVKNIVSIVTRIMFFVTPLFWSIEGLPDNIAFIMKINPLYYIVNGYRESLIFNIQFWNHPLQTIYFWSLSILIFIIGVFVFKRLKPHFADVI
jgi:ABC-type polysaccharide/polyol phosphate export permease